MTEAEFKSRWESEQSIYEAWGKFILTEVSDGLSHGGKDLSSFFKVPASQRLKTTESLVDKAFYRDKNYDDPYIDIEDKVGVRFVVLLLDDIKTVCEIIESSDRWTFDACKHFDEDKEREPLLFTYQSVHYILRPSEEFEFDQLRIPIDTPCEVQIRTLLQHAHAELTHDAIYKSKKKIKPSVHRTVAKSMALIETTDEFFVSATKEINFGPLQEHSIIERLNGLYKSYTGLDAHLQKSSLIIWDEFESIISKELISDIQDQLINVDKYNFLPGLIQSRYAEHALYQQNIILFLYWMVIRRPRRLIRDWPFSKDLISTLATDVGVSLE